MSSVKEPDPEIRPYDEGAMAGRPATTEAPEFGRRLTELRKKRGLTQTEFALMLGVSQKTVNHYERRTANPSLDLISRLAAFFDVSAAELVDEGATPAPRNRKTGPKSLLDEAVEHARQLPSHKQKVVAQLIEAYVAAEK